VHQHTTHGKSEIIRKMDSRFHGNDEVMLFPSLRIYGATSEHLPPTKSAVHETSVVHRISSGADVDICHPRIDAL